jgi:HlyD family secretion protein
MSKQRRFSIKLIILTLVILSLGWSFMPSSVLVDVARVSVGDFVVTVEGEGLTQIHDIYTVSTPIEGRITRIDIEPGDLIKAGETVIANMFPANPRFLDERAETQAKADVEGARAALSLAGAKVRQTQAQLEYEQASFKRSYDLFGKNLISRADLERAELQLKTLKAELETALSNQAVMAARLDSAKAILLQPHKINENDVNSSHCHICIRSPVDGQILRILHKSEGVVPAATPLVEVGHPDDLEIKIEMLSVNAVQVSPGNNAIIKRWGGPDLKAIVRRVEPSGYTRISALGVEEQRVNVLLDLIDPVETRKGLGDAYRVEAEIIIDRERNTLLAPISSLFRIKELWSVFKVEEGMAKLQTVEIGRRNDHYAEILEGLQEDDLVILHPSNDIKEGVKVKVLE